jgi:cell division protein FtsL
MSGTRFLIWLATLVIGVGSGVQVSLSAQQTRTLYAQLEEAQQAQDDALAVQSRVLIERAAHAAYQNVERDAQVKLGMLFPPSVKTVEP